jgi:2-keto-4-pentenoate hydratase/2-oxohepta-3-ene-1,7-dioic acid hydratase in catechol pathway
MHFVRFRDPGGSTRQGIWKNGKVSFGENEYDQSEVDVLPPTTPSKFVCVGLNYMTHAEELGRELPDRPVLFLKGPNAVAGPNDEIQIPERNADIEHEIELGIVIEEQCRSVPETEAMEVVKGFTAANDISNRDQQWNEQNNVRGKSFDNAAPIGPTITTPDEVPEDASLELRVNGTVRQRSTRNELIFSVPEIISEITDHMTLESGDIILTGTPEGVGPLEAGDEIEVDIEGIPTLHHTMSE